MSDSYQDVEQTIEETHHQSQQPQPPQQPQQHTSDRALANPKQSHSQEQKVHVQDVQSQDYERAASPVSEGVVVIEVCEKCHEHAWCTQHDESKYNAIYTAVKAQLEVHPNGSLKVFRNVNPNNLKQKIIPRRGAFEIILDGVVVYSKISSTLFPAPGIINDRVTKFLQDKNGGGDLSKYANSIEKKQEPPKKPLDKAQIYGKYYVAIQEEQLRQSQLREQHELQRQEQERQEEEKRERDEEERLRVEEQARIDEEERVRQQEEEEEAQRLEQERHAQEQHALEEQLKREEEEHQHQLEQQLNQEAQDKLNAEHLLQEQQNANQHKK